MEVSGTLLALLSCYSLPCSSEGIQIGGIGSAMGVVGSWTGANHEHGEIIRVYGVLFPSTNLSVYQVIQQVDDQLSVL